MIPANKGRLFERLFAWHAHRKIRAHFSEVRAIDLDRLQQALSVAPVLLLANHSAWWDPLWALALVTHRLRADGYAMMDARNLRRLPFFAKVGAFGVDLEDAADGARAIRYAAALLDRPGRLVVIYPQGEEQASRAPQLLLRPGSALVQRLAKGAIPIAMGVRYEHRGQERPSLWAGFEAVEPGGDRAETLICQGQAIERALDKVDHALSEDDLERAPLLFRSSRGRGLELASAALAALTRGDPPALPDSDARAK